MAPDTGGPPTRWDVERAVMAAPLAGPQVCLMLAILTYTQGGTTVILPEFTPSLTGLARASGYSRSVVADHLSALEEAKWLERSRPATVDAIAKREKTLYRPRIPPGAEREPSGSRTSPAPGLVRLPDYPQSGSRTSTKRTGGKPAGRNQSGSRTSPAPGHNPEQQPSRTSTRPNTRAPKRAEYDDPQFAEFWKVYPKKTGKRVAWKSWLAAIKRAGPAEIIAGAKAYAAVRGDEDPTYTKDPSGWLTADRWADEIPTPAAATARRNGHRPYTDPEDQSGYYEPMFAEYD